MFLRAILLCYFLVTYVLSLSSLVPLFLSLSPQTCNLVPYQPTSFVKAFTLPVFKPFSCSHSYLVPPVKPCYFPGFSCISFVLDSCFCLALAPCAPTHFSIKSFNVIHVPSSCLHFGPFSKSHFLTRNHFQNGINGIN